MFLTQWYDGVKLKIYDTRHSPTAGAWSRKEFLIESFFLGLRLCQTENFS